MTTFKRILVPVDFSPNSHQALAKAGDLAKSLGASIELLHVLEQAYWLGPDTMLMVPGSNLTLIEYAQVQADTALDEMLSTLAVPATARIATGRAHKTILEVASRDGFDLIAMGTHGRSGFVRLLLGSVAEKVVRGSTIPVLLIREEADD